MLVKREGYIRVEQCINVFLISWQGHLNTFSWNQTSPYSSTGLTRQIQTSTCRRRLQFRQNNPRRQDTGNTQPCWPSPREAGGLCRQCSPFSQQTLRSTTSCIARKHHWPPWKCSAEHCNEHRVGWSCVFLVCVVVANDKSLAQTETQSVYYKNVCSALRKHSANFEHFLSFDYFLKIVHGDLLTLNHIMNHNRAYDLF